MLKIKSYHPFGTLIAAMLAMLMHAVPRYEDPFLAMLERHAPEEGSIQVIGAGQGTTGTHSMYFEMCAMQFRSAHFNMFCNVRHATPMPEFLRLVRPTDYAGVRDVREGGNATTLARSNRDRMLRTLRLLQNQSIEAIFDTPVPSYFDELRAFFPHAWVLLTKVRA